MAAGRGKKHTFSAYKGSFVATELDGLITFIGTLEAEEKKKKKEKDEETIKFLADLKQVINLSSWVLSYFEKGKVPNKLDIGVIGVRGFHNRAHFFSLWERMERWFTEENLSDFDDHQRPINVAIYACFIKLLEIAEKLPSTYSKLLPFFNLDTLLKKIEELAGVEGSPVAIDDEFDSDSSEESESDEKEIEDLIKLFPSIKKIYLDIKKIRKLSKNKSNSKAEKKAKKKAMILAISSISKQITDITLPLLSKLPILLPLFSVHKKIQQGHDPAELLVEIDYSIKEIADEISYFTSEIQLEKYVDKKSNPYEFDVTHGCAVFSLNMLKMYQAMLRNQRGIVSAKHVGAKKTKPVVVKSDNTKKAMALPKLADTPIGKHLSKTYKTFFDIHYKYNRTANELATAIAGVYYEIELLMKMAEEGKVAGVHQGLTMNYLGVRIDRHFSHIFRAFYALTMSRSIGFKVSEDNIYHYEIVEVFYQGIVSVIQFLEQFPKKIDDAFPFANVDEVLKPLYTLGLDKPTTQALYEYLVGNLDSCSNFHVLLDAVRSLQKLESKASDDGTIDEYKKLMKTINTEIGKLTSLCVVVPGAYYQSGQYYRYKFYIIMLNHVKKICRKNISKIAEKKVEVISEQQPQAQQKPQQKPQPQRPIKISLKKKAPHTKQPQKKSQSKKSEIKPINLDNNLISVALRKIADLNNAIAQLDVSPLKSLNIYPNLENESLDNFHYHIKAFYHYKAQIENNNDINECIVGLNKLKSQLAKVNASITKTFVSNRVPQIIKDELVKVNTKIDEKSGSIGAYLKTACDNLMRHKSAINQIKDIRNNEFESYKEQLANFNAVNKKDVKLQFQNLFSIFGAKTKSQKRIKLISKDLKSGIEGCLQSGIVSEKFKRDIAYAERKLVTSKAKKSRHHLLFNDMLQAAKNIANPDTSMLKP